MKTKHNYSGTEFKNGDIAMLDWGGSAGEKPCTVKAWTTGYGGWWYVQLPNGGMHYTQRLVVPGKKNWWN